ncbi:hypothetical protein CP061683_1127A, partial [Chlamydia psittaci 06-1683]
MVIYP